MKEWIDIERYKQDYLDGTIVFDIWCLEDIEGRVTELGYTHDETKSKEVLSLVFNKRDAATGINWDVIDYWVQEVYCE